MNEFTVLPLLVITLSLVALYAIKRLRKRIDTLKEEASNFKNENEQLQSLYQNRRELVDKYQKELDSVKSSIKNRQAELDGLRGLIRDTDERLRVFRKHKYYEKMEELRSKEQRLDKYVKDVQGVLDRYKGITEPHKCTATIDMLLKKLKLCCNKDASDDVDGMLDDNFENEVLKPRPPESYDRSPL